MNISLLLNDMSSVTGALFLIFAYWKVSTDRWSSNDKKFYIVNFIGAVFALIGVIYRFNLSVIILEIVFGFLSLQGWLRVRKLETEQSTLVAKNSN